MKLIFAALTLLAAGTPNVLSASVICPATFSTNTDCGYIITIGPGGSLTSAPVPGAIGYDGTDDALVGVVNNSGAAYNGSFTLTGSGNGGGIFSFDGDGICTFIPTNSVSLSYCSTPGHSSDPGDYAGPLNTFSGISSDGTTGTVTITGLANGATTFFSLESSPASINGIVVNGTPEPVSAILFGSGIFGIFLLSRRRRA